MKKEIVEFPGVNILGLSSVTNNMAEMKPETGKIGPLVQKFMSESVMADMSELTIGEICYCAYTNFESDHTGPYTYVIGKEAKENIGETVYNQFTLPAQKYVKFTTEQGPLPQIIISAWMQIWQMTEADFGGKRTFNADFEIYDDRAMDRENAIVDIYIGIE